MVVFCPAVTMASPQSRPGRQASSPVSAKNAAPNPMKNLNGSDPSSSSGTASLFRKAAFLNAFPLSTISTSAKPSPKPGTVSVPSSSTASRYTQGAWTALKFLVFQTIPYCLFEASITTLKSGPLVVVKTAIDWAGQLADGSVNDALWVTRTRGDRPRLNFSLIVGFDTTGGSR